MMAPEMPQKQWMKTMMKNWKPFVKRANKKLKKKPKKNLEKKPRNGIDAVGQSRLIVTASKGTSGGQWKMNDAKLKKKNKLPVSGSHNDE